MSGATPGDGALQPLQPHTTVVEACMFGTACKHTPEKGPWMLQAGESWKEAAPARQHDRHVPGPSAPRRAAPGWLPARGTRTRRCPAARLARSARPCQRAPPPPAPREGWVSRIGWPRMLQSRGCPDVLPEHRLCKAVNENQRLPTPPGLNNRRACRRVSFLRRPDEVGAGGVRRRHLRACGCKLPMTSAATHPQVC